MKKKIKLFIENNGVTEVIQDRKPYLNSISTEIADKVTIPQENPEGYFGLFGGQFFGIFNVIQEIPDNDRFYYPIILSITELFKYVNKIEIPQNILEEIKNGNCKILIVCPYEGWELDWYESGLINPLINNYKLTYNDIVLLSGNIVKTEKYKKVYFNFWELNHKWRDTFMEKTKGKIAIFNTTRPYKFISLNRRCHAHRFALVSELYEYKDQGLLSFYRGGHSQEDLAPTFRYYHTEKDKFIKSYPELSIKWDSHNIDDQVPLMIGKDLDPYDLTDLDVNPTVDHFTEKFYKSYLHVVTETFHKGEGFISEKMFKPIIFFQPFVAIAQVNTLKYFKELGYRTFSEFIDESYDSEVDDQIRIKKSTKSIIDFISQDNLQEIIEKMYPILEYNYNHLINRCEIIRDLLKEDLENALL